MQSLQECTMSYQDQPPNPRDQENGILFDVPAQIFSQEICALIDSSAMRCFISQPA